MASLRGAGPFPPEKEPTLEQAIFPAYDLRNSKFRFDRLTGRLSMVRISRINRRARAALTLFFVAALFLAVGPATGQDSPKKEIFKSRLSPVPIDLSMMARVAGGGTLTATLSGKILTIAGTFEGLRSPATTAQIHRGPKGIPGPAILDITVSNSEKGAVSGSLELTPDQIMDLRAGRLYVQIQSERAPEGNLWGWMLQP